MSTIIKNCNFTVDRKADPEVLKVLLEVAKGYIEILNILEKNIEYKQPIIELKQ